MTRRLAFMLFSAGALSLGGGCANTRVPPHSALAPTKLEPDEVRLWNRAAEEQQRIDRSPFLADLPEQEAYLEAIVARLRPAPLPEGADYTVRIVADPTLNAFAYPHGAIYVHTGLLSRLDNEAQLASVLGHEVVHTTHRHGLRTSRRVKNATAFHATFTVGTYGVGALLGGLGALASISGYSQELEREADLAGFALLVAAGYDPREAPKAFRRLQEEAIRTELKEPFFFGSHPRLAERIRNFDTQLARLPAERHIGDVRTTEYARIMLPAFRLDAEAALRAGDLEQAEASAKRTLELAPGDPVARLHLAEARRRRADKDSLATARSELEALTRDAPELARAWRALGLVLQHLDETDAAARCFQRYLELAPDAPDRAHFIPTTSPASP